jgi:hypothetical protein
LIIIFCFLLYRFGKKADQFSRKTYGFPWTFPFWFHTGLLMGFQVSTLQVDTAFAPKVQIITGVDDGLLQVLMMVFIQDY